MYLEQLHDSDFKGSLAHGLTEVLYLFNQQPRFNDMFVCKEVFMSVPIVIFTAKDSFLIDALNEKIGYLKSAGLIEYWHMNMLEKSKMEPKQSKIPKVIRTRHLSGCFQVWIAGLALSTFILIFEVVVKKMFGKS